MGGGWTIGDGNNNSEGPSYDHSTDSDKGHYAFVHGTNHSVNVTGAMMAVPPSSSENICLNFWYHMDGSNKKNLKLLSFISQPESEIY